MLLCSPWQCSLEWFSGAGDLGTESRVMDGVPADPCAFRSGGGEKQRFFFQNNWGLRWMVPGSRSFMSAAGCNEDVPPYWL